MTPSALCFVINRKRKKERKKEMDHRNIRYKYYHFHSNGNTRFCMSVIYCMWSLLGAVNDIPLDPHIGIFGVKNVLMDTPSCTDETNFFKC